MTRTSLDVTPFGPPFKSVGQAYWLIAPGLAALALWVPGRWWVKGPIAVLILGGFAYPMIARNKVQQHQVDAAKSKLDAAMAHFEMRCRSGGEDYSHGGNRRWRDVDEVAERTGTQRRL